MSTQKSSKELLIDSVIELLSKYPIEKLTVSKIAESCSLSKRTFYYHFSDKYDLANKAYYYQMRKYCENHKDSLSLHGFMTHMAEFIHNHPHYIKHIVMYKGQNNLADSNVLYMRKIFVYIIENSFGDRVTDELFNIITFYIGGMTQYATTIFLEGTEMNREEAISLFEKCIPMPLQKYL
ncbi:MAG: TetR/AcrR family transcriptional regulator [Lachnospiraceae bacterium]|nr:TetR/AcrR family transcriptional regulator [Lachnospiraceae bacterium]